MTSHDILDLIKQTPPHIRRQMKQAVTSGSVIWFVEDETGKGKVCVYRCNCGEHGVVDLAASDELCQFFGVPKDEPWVGNASHVKVAPNLGQRLARHERG